MSDTEYEVEAVVDFRVYRGKEQYLIKWVGYPSDANTWEDLSNLNCDDFINQFRKAHPEKIENESKKLKNSKKTVVPKTSKATEKPVVKDNPKNSPKTSPASSQTPKETVSKSKQSTSSKSKVVGVYKSKGIYYYTISENGKTKDVKSAQARAKYATEIIQFLEEKNRIETDQK
ncbi:chromobox-like protein 5 [Tritrichomonas foetus]|uniref:Chromobox-like protein 5 n=1 Tax=Tritrichomonas foetus TaxID=1144522 RepID=A0A1J4JP10_9EUKA|nr:chromobox-like protein 5 [Tritrichomonas foetus]|eukprot:OHT00865.1 chromobox-like protein 5 [Tritrichomonas foetus]